MKTAILLALAVAITIPGCMQSQPLEAAQAPATPPLAVSVGPRIPSYPDQAREQSIPLDAVKVAPQADAFPPIMRSVEFEEPVPLSGPVNTAGAEDSPFITPDGGTLYFFFTPDVRIPVEKQLLDNATGIYSSSRGATGWSMPKRVWLQDPGRLSLDGCQFVQGARMWFCSAREGYSGIHWFTADFKGGSWRNWQNADFPASYEVGELHFSADGNRLFFHSARAGGKGGLDIWVSEKDGDGWSNPADLEAVNSPQDDGWPFVSQDGGELWFLRTVNGTPAIMRSKKTPQGGWAAPELIVWQFAGEPSLDREGNLYFVHHYYAAGRMVEADIYFAKRKPAG